MSATGTLSEHAKRRTYTFHVEMEYVLEVARQTREQSVVAPVVGKVCNGHSPNGRRLKN